MYCQPIQSLPFLDQVPSKPSSHGLVVQFVEHEISRNLDLRIIMDDFTDCQTHHEVPLS